LITKIQAEVAHRLARAHGHAWACNLTAEETVELLSTGYFSEGHVRNYVGLDERLEALATISKIRSVEADPWTVWGIHSPYWDGAISHRTGYGYGRLEWSVEWNGIVSVALHRPAGIAARGLIATDGQIDFWREMGGPLVHQRHIWSLVRLVRIVADRSMWSVWRKLTNLLEPDPELEIRIGGA